MPQVSRRKAWRLWGASQPVLENYIVKTFRDRENGLIMIYCYNCDADQNRDNWDEEYLDCGHKLCIQCSTSHDDYRDCPENTPKARENGERKNVWKERDTRAYPGQFGKWKR